VFAFMAMLVASMAAASFSAFAQISQSDLPGANATAPSR